MPNKEFVGDLQPVQPRVPYEERHKPVPGPGSYEIRDEVGPKAARSTSPRRNEVFYIIIKLASI